MRMEIVSSLGVHRSAIAADGLGGQAQHDSIEALVGNNQVGAVADHAVIGAAGLRQSQSLSESIFGRRLDEHLGRAPDSEARMTAQQSSLGDGYIGNTGKLIYGFLPDGHLVKL